MSRFLDKGLNRPFKAAFVVSKRRYPINAKNKDGNVVLPAQAKEWPNKPAMIIGDNGADASAALSRKGTLKMELKIGQWAHARREDRPQMLHGLQ